MRRILVLVPLLSITLLLLVSGPAAGAAEATALTRYEQNAPQLVYAGTWSVASATEASRGSFRYANTPGMAVTVAFSGTYLAWIAKKAPNYGLARVTLDGGTPVMVDLYDSRTVYQQKAWETGVLPAGCHTVRIEWTGTKNNAATKTNIGVDAFDVAGTLLGVERIEQTDRHLGWRGSWTKVSSAYYSAGTAWYANSAGSSVTIEFDGVGLTLLGKKGPTYGFASVSLDGSPPLAIDLFNRTIVCKQTMWASGPLPPGRHAVTFSWTGKKRTTATNTNVGLDSVTVVGTLVAAPTSPLAFDNTRAMAHLRKLAVDIGVRHGGSPQEMETVRYAMDHLSALGYTPRVMDVPLPDGATSHNVVVTKRGSSRATILVGAHMDSYGVSPGGNDNGSGSAAVLELARALKDVDLVPTVVLVLFGHEEPRGDGNADHHHYGSRRYVAAMATEQQVDLAGVISLDMIGYGGTFNVRFMEKGPKALVDRLLSYSARTGSGLVYLKDPSPYGYSDHEPFELAGYPAAWLEWRADGANHTSGDTYSHCSAAKIERAGGLVLGFLAGLCPNDLAALLATRKTPTLQAVSADIRVLH